MLELGESIEAGLVREVREETGALVAAVALTGVYKNMARGIVALVFRCRIVEGAVRMTDEAQAFRWLRSDELADYMDEVYAVRMRDALVGGSPAVRSHDGRVLLS